MVEQFEEMEIRPLRRRPSYHLLRPEEQVTFSRYFFEKWVPLLGPTRSMVILKFRSFCAGKQSVVLRMAEAAKAIEISERHLRRILQDEWEGGTKDDGAEKERRSHQSSVGAEEGGRNEGMEREKGGKTKVP